MKEEGTFSSGAMVVDPHTYFDMNVKAFAYYALKFPLVFCSPFHLSTVFILLLFSSFPLIWLFLL